MVIISTSAVLVSNQAVSPVSNLGPLVPPGWVTTMSGPFDGVLNC